MKISHALYYKKYCVDSKHNNNFPLDVVLVIIESLLSSSLDCQLEQLKEDFSKYYLFHTEQSKQQNEFYFEKKHVRQK